jgi:hypothetical protein
MELGSRAMETRYQRIAREQAERQAARAKKMNAWYRNQDREARAMEKRARAARKERAYHESLVSDHNHEMDA